MRDEWKTGGKNSRSDEQTTEKEGRKSKISLSEWGLRAKTPQRATAWGACVCVKERETISSTDQGRKRTHAIPGVQQQMTYGKHDCGGSDNYQIQIYKKAGWPPLLDRLEPSLGTRCFTIANFAWPCLPGLFFLVLPLHRLPFLPSKEWSLLVRASQIGEKKKRAMWYADHSGLFAMQPPCNAPPITITMPANNGTRKAHFLSLAQTSATLSFYLNGESGSTPLATFLIFRTVLGYERCLPALRLAAAHQYVARNLLPCRLVHWQQILLSTARNRHFVVLSREFQQEKRQPSYP